MAGLAQAAQRGPQTADKVFEQGSGLRRIGFDQAQHMGQAVEQEMRFDLRLQQLQPGLGFATLSRQAVGQVGGMQVEQDRHQQDRHQAAQPHLAGTLGVVPQAQFVATQGHGHGPGQRDRRRPQPRQPGRADRFQCVGDPVVPGLSMQGGTQSHGCQCGQATARVGLRHGDSTAGPMAGATTGRR